MDKFFFLSYCLTNTLLYTLIKYFHLNLGGYSTLEIMGYSNITSFFCFLPYIVRHFKKFIKNFKKYSGFSINVIASALKVYVIQYISPRNAMVISFTQPIFIVLLSLLTIEKNKSLKWQKYSYIPISFIGVIVFVGFDIQKYSFAYLILLVHVFLKAITNIYIKKISGDRYLSWCYSVMCYGIFGFIVTHKNFDYTMLYNKHILILSFISAISQYAQIKAYDIAERISLLQNLDYSRIVFTFIFTWLLLNERFLINQVTGASIIIASIYLSQKKFSKSRNR
jgi:drug/metabolite transporter (DMT)-like permease